MNNRISAAVFGAALLFSSASQAQQSSNGFYMGAAFGPALFFNVDLDSGIVSSVNNEDELEYGNLNFFRSGFLGYRFGDYFRPELELLFESGEGENVESNIYRLTGSMYIDIPAGGVKPYVGGGLGMAYDNNGRLSALDGAEFTFHGETGAGIDIAENIEFVPGTRFEFITTDSNVDDNQWIWSLRFGVRYFPF